MADRLNFLQFELIKGLCQVDVPGHEIRFRLGEIFTDHPGRNQCIQTDGEAGDQGEGGDQHFLQSASQDDVNPALHQPSPVKVAVCGRMKRNELPRPGVESISSVPQ